MTIYLETRDPNNGAVISELVDTSQRASGSEDSTFTGNKLITGTLTVEGHSAIGPDAAVDDLLPWGLYNIGPPTSGTITPAILSVHEQPSLGATVEQYDGVRGVVEVQDNAYDFGYANGVFGFVGVDDSELAKNLTTNGVAGVVSYGGQVTAGIVSITGGFFWAETIPTADNVYNMYGIQAMAYLHGGEPSDEAFPTLVGASIGVSVLTPSVAHVTAGVSIPQPYNTGTIETLYGLWIADQTPSSGTLTNPAYAIYSDGNNPSHFGGPIDVLNLPTTDPSRTGAFWTIDSAGVAAALAAGARYVMLSKGP